MGKGIWVEADGIFNCIFFKKNVRILVQILLTFVHMGPIGIKWKLVQVMAWRHIDAKPLPESMMSRFTDAYMRPHA